MLTGEIRSQIDQIWNAFWSGEISNPLEVIEQITYLLFLKRLDEQEIAEELKANRERKPMQKRFFPEGKDSKKRSYQDYRWNRFKNSDPRDMYTVVSEHVFPWLRTLGGNGTTYSKHMEGARFTIPTPALLAKVVDMIDKVPMEDRDTKGDLYEYMLGKIASAGQNGQFRTPRHIIRLMVEMVEPKPTDIVCDPACGTCGFLVAVGESLRERHPEVMTNAKLRQHFHRDLFHGFDFDNTMLRIGSMNMLLHGVENPDIRYRDSLAQDHAGEEEKYTLLLANPPFAGSLDYETCAKDLLQVVKTKKTELLFLALFLRLLKPGGRAAVIVPDGVLFGSSNAHKTLRRLLVEEQKLDAVTQSLFLDLFGDPVLNPRKWPQENLETVFHFRTGKLDSNAAVASGQYPFFTCSRENFRIDTFAFDCEALLLASNNASADYSVKHYKGKFNAYQRTYVITLRDERNSYDYSRFVLEHRLTELKRISKGTNTKYLTMELLNRIRVQVPPIELQREFARRAGVVEKLKTAQRASLAELDALFATLQHQIGRAHG